MSRIQDYVMSGALNFFAAQPLNSVRYPQARGLGSNR